MKIYCYDPVSLEYLEEKEASKDPLQSLKEGKDVFLLPSFSSKTKPNLPYKHGFAVVYDLSSDGWKYAEDHRGKTLWHGETGEKIVVSSLSIKIEDYVEEEPKKSEAKPSNEELLAEISRLKEAVEANLWLSKTGETSDETGKEVDDEPTRRLKS